MLKKFKYITPGPSANTCNPTEPEECSKLFFTPDIYLTNKNLVSVQTLVGSMDSPIALYFIWCFYTTSQSDNTGQYSNFAIYF